MASLKVGVQAPDFTLPDADGNKVSLKSLRGSTVILYFYPKDNTSGCTREACDFRDNITVLRKKGAVVIGVSADSVASHKKFADKYDLPFTLVSDEAKELVKKYGVWKKKTLYGRIFNGIERTTFVIGPDGTITHIFPKVRVVGHVEQLLNLV
ncbi:MAG: thioredoxin-dependent thiol peroxidase [Bacteroidota bacterium]